MYHKVLADEQIKKDKQLDNNNIDDKNTIKKDFKVHESAIPINLERSINKILIEKGINQPWSKRHA